jgi:hypothetical protein
LERGIRRGDIGRDRYWRVWGVGCGVGFEVVLKGFT